MITWPYVETQVVAAAAVGATNHIRIKRRKTVSRIMYDSANLAAVPSGADIVAYYPWSWGGDVHRFGKSTLILSIDASGDHPEADIADWEKGGIQGSLVAWLQKHEKLRGTIGTVYCNISSIDAVNAECGDEPSYRWIADPTGVLHRYDHADATQCKWPGRGSPGDYDISLVSNDEWPYGVKQDLWGIVHYHGFKREKVKSDDGGLTWRRDIR